MNQRNAWAVAGVCLGLNVLACSSGRDVEVSGKVTAPSSVMAGNKLHIDFIDEVGEGDAVEKSVAHSVDLESIGDFKETVSLEGSKVLIRAIDDRDGNGECSTGEAWGEVEAEITEDKVEAVSLVLGTAACPAAVE
jgi:hypothetical protein